MRRRHKNTKPKKPAKMERQQRRRSRARVRRRPADGSKNTTQRTMVRRSLICAIATVVVREGTGASAFAPPSACSSARILQSESRIRRRTQTSIYQADNEQQQDDDDKADDDREKIPDLLSKPYASSLVREFDEDALRNVMASLERENYLEECETNPEKCEECEVDPVKCREKSEEASSGRAGQSSDPLWEQIKLEAENMLASEPQSGPQLYSLILSQPSLIEAVATIISNEIETELIPATSLRNLFLELLTAQDRRSITLDIMAAALRSPSVGTAVNAIVFNRGLHALVCYRVGHRLWQAGRTGLAYYMQSTVSSRFSADIHPAARMGSGIYLNCGGGIVIGETAVIGDDVSILQGVTLGGTGKEAGDRHPKVGDGVILSDGATVLGNIEVGDGAVVTAKSIVTKPVPPLARVAGVPAKVVGY